MRVNPQQVMQYLFPQFLIPSCLSRLSQFNSNGTMSIQKTWKVTSQSLFVSFSFPPIDDPHHQPNIAKSAQISPKIKGVLRLIFPGIYSSCGCSSNFTHKTKGQISTCIYMPQNAQLKITQVIPKKNSCKRDQSYDKLIIKGSDGNTNSKE